MARHNSDRLLILVSCLALLGRCRLSRRIRKARAVIPPSILRCGRARFREAAALLEKQAKAGSADAQYELGSLYRIGRGVEQNDEAAFHWMKEAASQGHVRAQYSLATMYLTGRGTPVDVASAEAWAKRAQEKGHAEAAALLARIAAKQAAPAAPKKPPGWKASVATPFATAAVPANIPNEPRLILDAARRSNIEAVRKLAANRAGLEARDEDGNTALGVAASTGNAAILDALLVAGANIETRNNAQETPLMIAAANGRDQAVELLAGKRAALDAARPDQATALTLALHHCHEKTVADIAGKGRKPEPGRRDGRHASWQWRAANATGTSFRR